MKIEIECKLHLKNPEQIRSKLTELQAEDRGEVLEKNWVFDQGSKLRDSNSLLRLRIHDAEESGLITHKAPAQTGVFKSKHETETMVENAANMRHILEKLGYSVCWYYEKRRHTYILDGLTLVLDTTPELGVYIEIEGSADQEIAELLQKLGLDISNNTQASYAMIWRRHCLQQGREFCDWKF